MIDLRGNKNFGFVFFFSLPVSTLLLLTAPGELQPNTNSTPPLPGDSSSTTTRSAFAERHQLHHDAICLRHVTPTSLHRATHHHAICGLQSQWIWRKRNKRDKVHCLWNCPWNVKLYVPWVIVDGQPQYEEYENLIGYICKAYKSCLRVAATYPLSPTSMGSNRSLSF